METLNNIFLFNSLKEMTADLHPDKGHVTEMRLIGCMTLRSPNENK